MGRRWKPDPRDAAELRQPLRRTGVDHARDELAGSYDPGWVYNSQDGSDCKRVASGAYDNEKTGDSLSGNGGGLGTGPGLRRRSIHIAVPSDKSVLCAAEGRNEKQHTDRTRTHLYHPELKRFQPPWRGYRCGLF
jgi:hypothetical protein